MGVLEMSVGAVSSWPASAGEVTGGMISIVAGRPGSCGRIAGSSYLAARMAPPQGARGRADAVPVAAVAPYAARSRVKVLCCLMTSESFGCHDFSRHRWGGSVGWESCCLGLSEQTDPVTVVVAGVVWMHCTKVGCYWRRVGCTLGRWDLRAVCTTLGQWIPTLVQ